jgi:hypothetical protein
MGIFEPSIFLAIFPYAFMAAFPLFGVVVITKLELDKRRKRKGLNRIPSRVGTKSPVTEPADERMIS